MPYKLKSICTQNPLFIADADHAREEQLICKGRLDHGNLTCLKLQQERDMGLMWLKGSVHDCTALHSIHIE